MYKVKVNGEKDFEIVNNRINNVEQPFDLIEVKDGEFHVLLNSKSYTAIITNAVPEEKLFTIRVNGNDYDVKVEDKFDILLQQLGMGNMKSAKINQIKAPMPGLVFKLLVQAGDSIKKGDPVLILEAMKMENILKAPADATIKKICVNQGQAVEKGQVLVELD
jgi:biotin carboxyl carrier protein